MCWYSGLRHDGRCRERFDFADHGVLFLSQYLAIQTFEVLAVLREVGKREGGRMRRRVFSVFIFQYRDKYYQIRPHAFHSFVPLTRRPPPSPTSSFASSLPALSPLSRWWASMTRSAFSTRGGRVWRALCCVSIGGEKGGREGGMKGVPFEPNPTTQY